MAITGLSFDGGTVASTATPFPVRIANPSTDIVTGNITAADVTGGSASPTTGSTVILTATDSIGTIALSISGNSGGSTLQFEATIDGITFFSVQAQPIPTGALVTSTTASSGQWQINSAGYSAVRLRCSTFVSGTTAVTIRGTAFASEVEVVAASTDTLVGALTETAPASDTASSGLNGRLQRVAQRITSLIALIPTALGQGTMAQSLRVVLPSDQIVETAPKVTVVAGTALTRAANTTAYSTGDSVSDNATIGSVTALPVTLSDTNDIPSTLEKIRVDTADTGPGTAAIAWDIYVYRSDPTANSGVQGGDNTAFSNKRAGLIGRMTGTWIPMQDGSFLEAVPYYGNRISTLPGTGAKTVWLQYKTLGAFTPSANSLTYTPTVESFQARA